MWLFDEIKGTESDFLVMILFKRIFYEGGDAKSCLQTNGKGHHWNIHKL